jgi:hypothetical protein
MGLRTDNFIWKTTCKWYLRNRKSMQECPSISGLLKTTAAREKSLDGYRTCKVCLILWNTLTVQNKNCEKEREAIFNHCKESTARYVYLIPAGAPEVPETEFGLALNENRIQTIVTEVENILRNIP